MRSVASNIAFARRVRACVDCRRHCRRSRRASAAHAVATAETEAAVSLSSAQFPCANHPCFGSDHWTSRLRFQNRCRAPPHTFTGCSAPSRPCLSFHIPAQPYVCSRGFACIATAAASVGRAPSHGVDGPARACDASSRSAGRAASGAIADGSADRRHFAFPYATHEGDGTDTDADAAHCTADHSVFIAAQQLDGRRAQRLPFGRCGRFFAASFFTGFRVASRRCQRPQNSSRH